MYIGIARLIKTQYLFEYLTQRASEKNGNSQLATIFLVDFSLIQYLCYKKYQSSESGRNI